MNCPACRGSGRNCPVCGGDGFVTRDCTKCGGPLYYDDADTGVCHECRAGKRKRSRPFLAGQIVTSGTGADCFMGTILEVRNRSREALVKYADFKVPRLVRFAELRHVGE